MYAFGKQVKRDLRKRKKAHRLEHEAHIHPSSWIALARGVV